VNRRLGAAVALILVSILGAAGCSDDGGSSSAPPSTTAPPTTSTVPPPPLVIPPAVVDGELQRLQADDVAPEPPDPDDSDSDFGHHQLTKMRTRPIRSDAVRARLARELDQAGAFAVAHPRLQDALADGYAAQNFVDADGVHVVDWRLVTKRFDAAHPSMVIYESTEPSAPIVALSYVVESVGHQPAGFAGPNDRWHRHRGLCFKDGLLEPTAFKDPDKCALLAGRYLSGETLWMLHAWVAPGPKNPWGVFAIVNPRREQHADHDG
jgi:hypothetical protein